MEKVKQTLLSLNQPTKAILYALGGHSLFSFTHVAIKYLGYSLNAYAIAFWNDVFALITVLCFSKALGGLHNTIRSRHKPAHLLRGFFLTLGFIMIVIAFTHIPIANVNSMTFAAPLLGTLISIVVLGEKAKRYHWLAMMAGFGGVLIILRPGLENTNIYNLLALAGALSFALSMIFGRKLPETETKLSLAFYPIIVTLTVTGLLLLTDFQVPDMREMAILCASGFLSGFAVLCVGRSFTLAPVATVAPFEYVQIIWAMSFGFLVFGDRLDPYTAIGAVLIIAGGIYLMLHENRQRTNT